MDEDCRDHCHDWRNVQIWRCHGEEEVGGSHPLCPSPFISSTQQSLIISTHSCAFRLGNHRLGSSGRSSLLGRTRTELHSICAENLKVFLTILDGMAFCSLGPLERHSSLSLHGGISQRLACFSDFTSSISSCTPIDPVAAVLCCHISCSFLLHTHILHMARY